MTRHILHALALAVFASMCTVPVAAAPSLDPKAAKTIEIKVGSRKVKKGDRTVRKDVFRYYTCIMDHENPLLWYYIPPSLVLANDQDGLPVFDLVRYQLTNPEGDDALEGGVLQFAVAMDLSGFNGDVRTKVVGRLARAINLDPKLRKQYFENPDRQISSSQLELTVMPFDDVDVSLFAPGKEGFVSGVSMEEGAGPKYGGQSMPFTLELTSPGVALYEALTSGRTGVNVLYSVSFKGVTPAVGIEVTVKLEEAIKHFSNKIENRQSMAANIYGVDVEAALGVTNQDIINELEKNDVIEIKVLTDDEGFDVEAAKEYLDPLLEKIYEEVLTTSPTEELFEPATAEAIGRDEDAKIDDARPGEEAAAGETGGEGGDDNGDDGDGNSVVEDIVGDENVIPNVIPQFKTETNIGIKKVEQLTKKTLKWDLKLQSFRKKQTVIGGFIGLDMKGFSAEEKARFVRSVGDSKAMSKVNFKLPKIRQEYAEDMGITEIGLYASLVDERGNEVLAQQGATYSGESGEWTGNDLKGEDPSQYLQFLVGEHAEKKRFKDYKFKVKAFIARYAGSPKPRELPELYFEYEAQVFTGQSGLASPLSNLRIIEIDPSPLFDDDGYAKVRATIEARIKDRNGKVQSRKLRHFSKLDDWEYEPWTYLLPPDNGQYKPKCKVTIIAYPEDGGSEKMPPLSSVRDDVELASGLWNGDE